MSGELRLYILLTEQQRREEAKHEGRAVPTAAQAAPAAAATQASNAVANKTERRPEVETPGEVVLLVLGALLLGVWLALKKKPRCIGE